MPKFSDVPYFVLNNICKGITDTTSSRASTLKTVGHTAKSAGGHGMEVYLRTADPLNNYTRLKLMPIEGTPTDNNFRFTFIPSTSTVHTPSELTLTELMESVESEYNKVYFRKNFPLHNLVESLDTDVWTKKHMQYLESKTWTVEHNFGVLRNVRNADNFVIVCTDFDGNILYPKTIVSSGVNHCVLTFDDYCTGVADMTLSNQSALDNFVNPNKTYVYFGDLFVENVVGNIVSVPYYGMKDYVMELIPPHNRNDQLAKFMEVYFDQLHQQIYHRIGDLWSFNDPDECNIDFLHYLYRVFGVAATSLLSELKQRQYLAGLPFLLKRKGTYASLYNIWLSVVDKTTNYLNVYERWHDYDIPSNIPLPYFEDFMYTVHTEYADTPKLGGAGYGYYAPFTTLADTFVGIIDEPSDLWNIQHTMASKELIVQCYNTDFEMIFPTHVTMVSDYSIRVEFPEGMLAEGFVLVAKSEYTHEQIVASANWAVIHGLPNMEVFTSITDSTYDVIMPENTVLTEDPGYTVSFGISGSPSGYGFTADNTFLVLQEDLAYEWQSVHPYNIYVIVQYYDNYNNQIFPDIVKLAKGEVKATFPQPTQGYVIIKKLVENIVDPNASKCISPHYRIEIDLNNEPISNTDIMDEPHISTLIEQWNIMRPVSKYSHNSMLISPKTDFSYNYMSLYNNLTKSANLYSKSCIYIDVNDTGRYVYVRRSGGRIWKIQHDLGSSVITQCFDSRGRVIEPKSLVETSTNTVTVTFASPQSGYAFISPADSVIPTIAPSASWQVFHQLSGGVYDYDQNYPLVQLNDTTISKMIPSSVTSVSKDEYTVKWYDVTEGSAFSGIIDDQFTQTLPSTTWYINHLFNTVYLQVGVYDNDGEILFPTNITLIDSYNIKITFSEAVSGYVTLRRIGSSASIYEVDIIENLTHAEVGYGTSGIGWNPVQYNTLEASYGGQYTLTKTEDTNYFYVKATIREDIVDMNITEIGLFGSRAAVPEDIVIVSFYSYCSPIFKPAGVDLVIWYRLLKTK